MARNVRGLHGSILLVIGLGCSVDPASSSGFGSGQESAGVSATGASAQDTDGVDATGGSAESTTNGNGEAPGTDSAQTQTHGDPTGGDPTNGDSTDGSTTEISSCGDGVVDPNEECDTGLGGQSCEGLGFDGGTLSCAADCSWDTAGCHLCGDGEIGGPEVCDGDDLGGTACADLPGPNGNYTGGTLSCQADCSAFDEGDCTWCGDGIKNGPEACDGDDLDGATCVDAGWLPGGGGEVSCTPTCELDDALCTGTKCGDSLEVPPDGEGVCPDLWTDGGNACERSCPQLGPNVCTNPLQCPPDRACSVTCNGLNGCNGLTIECAAGHSCDVNCTNQSSCQSATIVCPPDAPCDVTCSSLSACSGMTLVCPAGNHACNLVCSAQSACANVDLQCGDGPCSMSCSNTLSVCSGAEIGCGTNACTATCAGNSMPNVSCGESCDCTAC